MEEKQKETTTLLDENIWYKPLHTKLRIIVWYCTMDRIYVDIRIPDGKLPNGLLVGSCTIYTINKFSLDIPELSEMSIWNLCVVEEYRRNHLGQLLMSSAMTAAKTLIKNNSTNTTNNAVISLLVEISNRAALSLYRKCGFSIIKTIETNMSRDGQAILLNKKI